MINQINHKTHMLADISRCPQESADFEKVIMTLLMRKLNRKIRRATISSEVKIEGTNDIADVGADLKDGWVYWEIQKCDSIKWFKKIADRDLKTSTETIPISIKPLIKKYGKILKMLSNDLEEFIIDQK